MPPDLSPGPLTCDQGNLSRTKLRVLLVDDEDAFRKVLRVTLERMGHIVSEARNGFEAVSAIAQNVPDLMITDIAMPDKDGFETIREIRRC